MTNSIVSYSPAFDKIAPPGTQIQVAADQTGAHEGPVYVADGDYLLYTTSQILGKILIDGGVANFTFGGQDNKTLYLCADPKIYQVRLEATGAGC